MAIFKCKMCGGTLEINNSETVAVCEYCDTKQTLPKLDDEKRVQLYDRANHFRRENEFDKAMGIYEMILSDDKEDCESYWGLVLCRYGIEYVEDPRTHKRIPTVNRAQFTSIFDDEDYKNAIKFADGYQKDVYETEACVIDKIQKGILEISNKEEPFDVFICYKETDKLGHRTQDSIYAQDIYTALTKEGYKVFFSRITLEDKLGSAYEPYIFAALNSAKVMLVVGTEKDNFNAVWVKNEWSRFLSFIKAGKDKTLIPVYKDITPYDMPEEFQYLQSQDMGKIGFMQDLIRGISKLVDSNKTTVKETVIVNSNNSQIEPLLKRTFMFLEDGDFARADEFCEQVLNLDPECAEAYLGKLLVDLKVCKQSDLKNCVEPFNTNSFYQKITRFADAKLTNKLKEDISYINERNEIARKDSVYEKAISIYQKSETAYRYKKRELYEEAYKLLDSISDWKDSSQISKEIKALDDALRIEDEEKEAALEKLETERKLKVKRGLTFGISISTAVILFLIVLFNVIVPAISYEKAVEFFDAENYDAAISIFEDLGDYKDSFEQVNLAKIEKANKLLCEKNYDEAYALLEQVGDISTINDSMYNRAIDLVSAKDYIGAHALFSHLTGYKDADTKLNEIKDDYNKQKRENAQVGDYIIFGAYEQDGDISNGKEEMEWLVLDKQGDKTLIISKYAIASKEYNPNDSLGVTWEKCSLRKWLNTVFLDDAFTDNQKMICTTKVVAHANPDDNINQGNDTLDKIFILSIEEANNYFSGDESRKCEGTFSAGAWSYNGYCSWWLRSIYKLEYSEAVGPSIVNYYGEVNTKCMIELEENSIGVRPAMWIEF